MESRLKNPTWKDLALLTVGAVTMYWLDPTRGRRRRARALYRTRGALRRFGRFASKTSRDARNRAQGTVAMAAGVLRHSPASDDSLLARVRSRIGLASDRARTIDVQARGGCVTLVGAVPFVDHAAILDAVRGVRGVREVVDDLEIRGESTGAAARGNGRE